MYKYIVSVFTCDKSVTFSALNHFTVPLFMMVPPLDNKILLWTFELKKSTSYYRLYRGEYNL